MALLLQAGAAPSEASFDTSAPFVSLALNYSLSV
jgi:hypothetical protein